MLKSFAISFSILIMLAGCVARAPQPLVTEPIEITFELKGCVRYDEDTLKCTFEILQTGACAGTADFYIDVPEGECGREAKGVDD